MLRGRGRLFLHVASRASAFSTAAAPPPPRKAAAAARFRDLLKTPELVQALNQGLNVFAPNAIQADALPLALKGEDVLVSAQTGSGKTLCFLLPILDRLCSKRPRSAAHQLLFDDGDQQLQEEEEYYEEEVREAARGQKKTKKKKWDVAQPEALILVPTRELGVQTCAVADALLRDLRASSSDGANSAAAANSSSSARAPEVLLLSNGNRFGPEKRALRQGGARLIVATPARLLYHMQEGSIEIHKVQQLAIDEVDAVLCAADGINRSKEVKDVLLELKKRSDKRRRRQYILTAATVSNEHERMMRHALSARPKRISHTGVLVPTLQQQFHFVRGDKEQELLRLLEKCSEHKWLREGATLVFCGGPRKAQRIFELLSEAGLPEYEAALLHGESLPDERRLALDKMYDSEVRVLVCTDIAARGLDFPLVNHVVMFDLPRDVTTYIHRAGRTARAGKAGLVTVMVRQKEMQLYHALRQGEAAGQPLAESSGREGARGTKDPPPLAPGAVAAEQA